VQLRSQQLTDPCIASVCCL